MKLKLLASRAINALSRFFLHPAPNVVTPTCRTKTSAEPTKGSPKVNPRDIAIRPIPGTGLAILVHDGRFIGITAIGPSDQRVPIVELVPEFEKVWKEEVA